MLTLVSVMVPPSLDKSQFEMPSALFSFSSSSSSSSSPFLSAIVIIYWKHIGAPFVATCITKVIIQIFIGDLSSIQKSPLPALSDFTNVGIKISINL